MVSGLLTLFAKFLEVTEAHQFSALFIPEPEGEGL
jgi:hypothetical protein